ncbi:RNA polymerase sigma factor [Chitinophaga nivalis]|uniref:RNA polymerase sigma-70 factor n=1 Tax=Chitinophaga nivalis TaxID=2991709 RepID=A0ABT3IL82_9BACT|nr:RNA polymerase sigma-70 factor [Chitinophaga nivalis]MCW3465587.1 RNA polymerase sigma-70 factor [Chitinophaga nivalis]MCW3484722.1 RNA polymerase sigma-70 factor [Chitinophaga nivalis]
MREDANIQLLAERVASLGDEQAYKALFRLFYKPLSQFACSIVKNYETAEEIAADVCFHMWKHRERLPQIDNLKVYLYVAAKNMALNHLAKASRNKHFSLDDLSVEFSLGNATPEQIYISGEMIRKIEAAVNALPPKRKIIFKLIREDGLKYKEVARILDISVNTIDVHMAQAMKKISEVINLSFLKSE